MATEDNEFGYVCQCEALVPNPIRGINFAIPVDGGIGDVDAIAYSFSNSKGIARKPVSFSGHLSYDANTGLFNCECPFDSGDKWFLYIWRRNEVLDGDIEWKEGQNIPVAAIVSDLNSIRRRLKDMTTNIARSIQIPEQGDYSVFKYLPPKEIRAGQVAGYDNEGNPAVGENVPEVAKIYSARDAAVKSAEDASKSSLNAANSASSATESANSAALSASSAASSAMEAENYADNAANSAEDAEAMAQEAERKLTELLGVLITKADKATTLEGYGITDAYTKTETDALVTKVYRYKGSVSDYADLPTSEQVIGDVWNVESDGSNYVWDGNAWDNLSGITDLSDYYTKEQTGALLNGYVKNTRLATTDVAGLVELASGIDDTGTHSVMTAAQVKETTQQKVDEEAIALQKTSLASGNIHKTIYDPVSKRYFTTTNTGVYSSPDGFNWICCLEGWFTSIATDNAGTILVGAYGAIPVSKPNSNSKGIWKSTDGGVTWTETNWQIATDNNNHNTKGAIWALGYGNGIWIAGTVGDSGILRSTDGGDNWELSNKTNGAYYSVAYHNGVYYVGLDSNGDNLGGILKSTDGGATWTQTNYTTGWVSHIQYFVSIGMLLATNHREGRVMYSTDGNTWTETFDSTATYGIAVDGEGKFYVYGYGNSRIARSSDGKNWEWITDKLPNRAYGVYGANGLLLFGTYGAGMLAQSMLRGGYVTKDEALALNVPANVELDEKIDKEIARAKEAETALSQTATVDTAGLVKLGTSTVLTNSNAGAVGATSDGQLMVPVMSSSNYGVAKVGGKGITVSNGNLALNVRADHSGFEFSGNAVYVQTATNNHPTTGTVAPVATDTAGKLVVLNATTSLPGGVKLATDINDTGDVAVLTAAQVKAALPDVSGSTVVLKPAILTNEDFLNWSIPAEYIVNGSTIVLDYSDVPTSVLFAPLCLFNLFDDRDKNSETPITLTLAFYFGSRVFTDEEYLCGDTVLGGMNIDLKTVQAQGKALIVGTVVLYKGVGGFNPVPRDIGYTEWGRGIESRLDGKQDTLVSGTNIKTINGQSLLGSGDIQITGGSGGTADLSNVVTLTENQTITAHKRFTKGISLQPDSTDIVGMLYSYGDNDSVCVRLAKGNDNSYESIVKFPINNGATEEVVYKSAFNDNFSVLPLGTKTALGADAYGLHVSSTGGLQLFGTHFLNGTLWGDDGLKVVANNISLTTTDQAYLGFDYANKVTFRTMPNDGNEATYALEAWEWDNDSHTSKSPSAGVKLLKPSQATALVPESVLNLQELDARFYKKTEVDGMLGGLRFVSLTQAEYNALVTKEPNTVYITTEGGTNA